MLTDDQARSGYVGLNRHGEALKESEDHLVAHEAPEVVSESLKVMEEHFGIPQATVAREMRVQPRLLQELLRTPHPTLKSNVISLHHATRLAS